MVGALLVRKDFGSATQGIQSGPKRLLGVKQAMNQSWTFLNLPIPAWVGQIVHWFSDGAMANGVFTEGLQIPYFLLCLMRTCCHMCQYFATFCLMFPMSVDFRGFPFCHTLPHFAVSLFQGRWKTSVLDLRYWFTDLLIYGKMPNQ